MIQLDPRTTPLDLSMIRPNGKNCRLVLQLHAIAYFKSGRNVKLMKNLQIFMLPRSSYLDATFFANSTPTIAIPNCCIVAGACLTIMLFDFTCNDVMKLKRTQTLILCYF